MRKKFTMLLATFLVCLGGVKAQAWLQPTVSTDDVTYEYYIANYRDQAYYVTTTAGLGGSEQALGSAKEFDDTKAKVTFKLTEGGKLYSTNTTSSFVVGYTTTESGGEVKLFTTDNNYTWNVQPTNGGHTLNAGGSSNSWNMHGGAGNNIKLYDNNDGGSNWVFIPANNAARTKAEEAKATVALSTEYYYQIKNAGHSNMLAANANSKAIMTSTNSVSDLNQLWAIEEAGNGKFYLRNAGQEKYLGHATSDNTAWPVVDEKIAFNIEMLNFSNKSFYISYNNGTGHSCAHEAGWSNAERVVGWEASAEASQWYFEKTNISVSAKEISFNYSLRYNDEEKFTQQCTGIVGEAYPDITIELPFGIVATKPIGKLDQDVENTTVAINLTENLPFEYAESYNAITNWYYIQMHSTPGSEKYIQAMDGYIEWADANIDANEIDSYTWGFVGNPFDGFKLVNYGAEANKAVNSNGQGNPALGDFATGTEWAIKASATNKDAEHFCFQYPGSNNYMNAQNGKIAFWTSADQGSTMWVTERDMSGATELQALIESAGALVTALSNSTGVGSVTSASLSALSTEISNAQAAAEAREGCIEAQVALQTVIDALETIQPEENAYYVIKSACNGDRGGQAIYTEDGYMKFRKTQNFSNWFKFVSAGNNKFYLYNVKNESYLSSAGGHNSGQVTTSTNAGEAKEVTITNMGNGNIVKIVPEDGAMIHAQAGGNIVAWNNNAYNEASAWTIEKVTNPGVAIVGDQDYPTLDVAIEAAEAGATVTLLKDIEVSSAVVVDKNLTIDMNGKTLTSDGDGFEVTAGTLTITGNGTVNAGTEGGLWVAVWANGGNAVIENGTYSVVAGEEGSTNDCIYAKLGGHITINGGTFRNNGTYYPNKGGVVINANNGNNNPADAGKITINGGTFNPAEGCVPYEVADVEAGRIELNTAAKVGNQYYTSLDVAIDAAEAGATVTLLKDIEVSSAVVVAKNLTIDMNSKTLTSAGDGFEVTAGGTLTITGNGTVNAGTEGGLWVAVWANGGNAVIENGTYSVVAGEEGSTNDCIYAKLGGHITIKGGTFRNNGTYYPNKGGVVINANNGNNNPADAGKITINGGTFNPAEGCVPYEVADVEAGRIELNTAAKVGNQYYTSLDAAIAAAEAGATVTLLKGIEVSSAVVVAKNLTIDMNGKTLTSAGDGFEVTAGTLTITGNGTVNAGTEGGLWVAIWANGGNAVIENGTYSVVAGEEGSTNDCIYAKLGGHITIKGGTFRNNGTYYPNKGGVVINANNGNNNPADAGKITINGGTFNPAKGCVPYEVADVEAGRIELNSVANETELKIAVAAGQNVTLGADIEVSSAVQVADVITLDLNGKSITRATGYKGYVFEVTGELIVTGGTIAQSGICYIINDADYKTEAGKTYAISEDKENVDIKYTRTFGHNSWQVLFVPFDIPLANMSEFKVYQIKEMNGDNTAIIVEEVTQNSEGDKVLEAHNPYFIKVKDWTASVEKTITVENATLKAAPEEDITWEYGDYTFYGTYAPKAISAMKEYVLTDGQWCQLTETAETNNANILGAFRVYLTAPNGTQANALSITRGETGIEELSTVNDQQSTVIYDLTGRKVETMDKGIYIVNGRKVVIK